MAKIRVHLGRTILVLFGLASMIVIVYKFATNAELNRKRGINEEEILPSYLACIQPNLNVNHSLLQLKYDPLICNKENDWMEVKGSLAIIRSSAQQLHGHIECTVTELLFKDDATTVLGKSIKILDSFELLTSDFYAVSCNAADGQRWEGTIAGIRRSVINNSSNDWNVVPYYAVKMNVLFLGFNSLSRPHFIHSLPKTYKFLKNELTSFVLKGYNIVGESNSQAIIAMLTGYSELELTKKYTHSGIVDSLICSDFKRNRFITLFAYDQPDGPFSYKFKGFAYPPTDHYMKIFFNHVFPKYGHHPKYCLGGTPRHKVFLNYLQNFFEVYNDKPKFAFALLSELSEDDQHLVAVADQDFLTFLNSLKKGGLLENTILALFSNNGHRPSSSRMTRLGKQEERLPFFSIYLPPSFKALYPSSSDNVRVNSGRLSTPFDIYATLKDLTLFSGARLGKSSDRGISLFSQIPPSRTCSDAFIEPHWCACLTWEPLPTSDDAIVAASHSLVHYINSHTAPYRAYCHEVKLTSILSAAILLPNQLSSQFTPPDSSANAPITEEIYQISIRVTPVKDYFRTSADLPIFEASLTYNVKQDSFSVKMDDVVRTNRHGQQPHCIVRSLPSIQKFCYCIQPPFSEQH